MFATLLTVPAAVLGLVAWIAYRHAPQARLFCVSILLGMGYWYLLPGTMFLLGREVPAADIHLLSDPSSIENAIVLVLASLALLLLLPALFATVGPLRGAFQEPDPGASRVRLDVILVATLCSSATFLADRYADLGSTFAWDLLQGLSSAREVMTYYNFSSGPGESLRALWDIVNIFLSLFLVATLTLQHRVLSVRFAGASAAAVLSFVSSGSRSVLLLWMVTVTTALICRPQAASATRFGRLAARGTLALLLMGGLITVAGGAMVARFPNSSQSESLARDSVGGHNDMFRELVFVLVNGEDYRSDAFVFLQTPIAYAMPTFLGFEKSIPPHLIDFSWDRARIDLVLGEGNRFPGLVADMYLCFGVWGPLVLCMFSAVLFRVFMFAATRGSNTIVNNGLLLTLLSYYVISFRNLQGAFGILVVLAVTLSLILPRGETPIPRT